MQVATTDSILDEIHSESLRDVCNPYLKSKVLPVDSVQLLTSVREKSICSSDIRRRFSLADRPPAASPLGCTHIPELDTHFCETVSDLPSPRSTIRRGDVIEIQGPPASGKTHLVYHFVLTCVLPSDFSSTFLGGWGKSAIVFDADGSFDVSRLHQLLRSRVARLLSLEQTSTPEPLPVDRLCAQALKKVHVFRPMSTAQLAVTLLHLPQYHIQQMPDAEIGLVAIDSISSHYWPDRFTVEQMRSAPPQGRRPTVTFKPPLHNVLSALQSLRSSHSPVIVLTNWGLNPLIRSPSGTSSSSSATLYRQHLHPFPSPFSPPRQPGNGDPGTSVIDVKSPSSFPLTHHITLAFITIPPFRPGISLAEARAEELKYRGKVVEKGEIVGIVRTVGRTRVGRFVFGISSDELLV
jgi:DNA-repair protein XRCC2